MQQLLKNKQNIVGQMLKSLKIAFSFPNFYNEIISKIITLSAPNFLIYKVISVTQQVWFSKIIHYTFKTFVSL